MSWLAGILVKLGLKESGAEKVAPWVAGALLCVLAALSAGLWLHFHDRKVIAQDRQGANLAAVKGQSTADAHAADQRVKDALANRDQEETYAKAIHTAQPGDSSDPDVRLACEQLRRAGKDTKSIPACGGR